MSFERACALSDLTQSTATSLTLSGQDVAIALQGEEVFAIEDQCSHALFPLSDGEVADCQIECSLHGSTFDLRTGKPTVFPATEPVATFACEIRGDDVYVDPAQSLNGVTPQ
ncbi:MAG: non-heme iron oxygenase ferredoxin subunit [Nocardioides sp.]